VAGKGDELDEVRGVNKGLEVNLGEREAELDALKAYLGQKDKELDGILRTTSPRGQLSETPDPKEQP
jgi:hypothetical protein